MKTNKQYEKWVTGGQAGLREALTQLGSAWNGAQAREFVRYYAEWLRAQPQTTEMEPQESVDIALHNLGYVTGEGVDLIHRQFWWTEALVRHPIVPEMALRHVTPEEMFEAGLRYGERMRKASTKS